MQHHFHLRYFEGRENCSFMLCLLVKTYLRINNQLITAQPQQDWGWNFDIVQLEVKS